MTKRLQGKIALVTGGASGVGLEVVKLLLGEGAKVAFSDINDAVGQQLAAGLGEDAMFVRHDVSSEADWTVVMQAVQQRFGTLNVLVNNAGILLPGDMETGRLEDFSRLLKINTESVFIGCQQGIAAMKQAGGSIINMASVSSWLPVEQYAGYSASKAAVSALTRAAALNCRKQGYAIRVNSIHPDGVMTPMTAGSYPKGLDPARITIDGDPMNRACLPTDVAAAILFLADDASRAVNGIELRVDSGQFVMSI